MRLERGRVRNIGDMRRRVRILNLEYDKRRAHVCCIVLHEVYPASVTVGVRCGAGCVW